MNIPLISGQIAKLHIKLETEDAFELYGGTTKAGFTIEPERPATPNEWLVTINESEVAGKPLSRFDVYVRQISTGREWVVLSGKILVSPRSAGVEADKLAPVEFNVAIPVVENAVDMTGSAIVTGIPGQRGWSAYEVAVQQGFEGTESEWLEWMRQQTATLAVEQVTPLMVRAETAATEAEVEATKAATSEAAAKASAESAADSAAKTAVHEDTVRGMINNAAASEQAAAESARQAGEHEAEADAALYAAKLAMQEANASAANASAASQTATLKATEAAESAAQAAADKVATEDAKTAAQAAQVTAEEQAAIATQAAADAQAPESIAAQAARPATMLLVRDELMSILGDASLFDLDTDGQKIVVHTDRLDDATLATVDEMLARWVPQFIEVARYNHNMEISWREINKYAHCVTKEDVLAVNPDFINDVTSDYEWVYPLDNIEAPSYVFHNNSHAAKKVLCYAPNATAAYMGVAWNNKVIEIDAYLPKVAHINCFVEYDNALKKVRIHCPLVSEIHLSHANKLADVEVVPPYPVQTKSTFKGIRLNKKSAIHVLSILPEWTDGKTHAGAFGIHIDHQNDEEVLAAIANAEAKGWTMTVQWNGTPTSGISLMDLEEIWCKVTESEYGEYTDENGKRVSLDWGHYVTDTSEYKLFFSLVEAEQYFKLTKIEQPAE